ncbi:MAG: SUMF1/EgtB/PvdO family nonheme iron enzyme [Alphaproteobacteria bacterium]|nr:SUMF1/EgtB/PvdO family nonheme iron enzyme [Alphaproteobacteria bacterium]
MILSFKVYSQTPCLNNNILVLKPSQFKDQLSIEKEVETWRQKFGRLPVSQQNQTIECLKNFNNKLEQDKLIVLSQINDIQNLKNVLIENSDVIAINKQLAEKKIALTEIKNNFKTQFDNLSLLGVYVVLLNRSSDEGLTAEALLNEARNFVVAKAIEDLNGSFIQMLEEQTNQNNVNNYSQIIKQHIKGSLELEPSFIFKEDVNNFNQKLYILTVKVNPLKQNTFNQNINLTTSGNKLITNDNLYAELNNIIFQTAEQKQHLIQKYEDFTRHCHEVNLETETHKKTIIENYQTKINNIQLEINDLNSKLSDKFQNIKDIANKIGVVYNEQNIALTKNNIVKELNIKLENKKNKIIDIFEQIWQFPQSTKVYKNTEKPIVDIATQIKSVKERLEQAGKMVLYQNNQELQDNLFAESTHQKLIVNRTVNMLWVELIQNDTYWEVVIYAQYHLSKESETDSENNGNSNQEKNKIPNNGVVTYTVNGYNFQMKLVEGGSFSMGCTHEQSFICESDEKPAHTVNLSGFYIGKFEVTQGLWKSVMGYNPSFFNKAGDDYPVENISWDDCQIFIKQLNQLTGNYFRLPTEAEWEFAARGGIKNPQQTLFSGSKYNELVQWDNTNSGNTTHQVGLKQPNSLGLYDMSGNVWEWCADSYGTYSINNLTNPIGTNSGFFKVLRGGSWDTNIKNCRVSNRGYYIASYHGSGRGLRLAISVH